MISPWAGCPSAQIAGREYVLVRPRLRSVQLCGVQYPYYLCYGPICKARIVVPKRPSINDGLAAYLSRITMLLLTQNKSALSSGHFCCTRALIIMPPNGYVADNGLLYKVQNTDITLVLDQYDNLIFPHRVWPSMLLISPIYLGISMQHQPRQCQTKGTLSPVPGSIYSKLCYKSIILHSVVECCRGEDTLKRSTNHAKSSLGQAPFARRQASRRVSYLCLLASRTL